MKKNMSFPGVLEKNSSTETALLNSMNQGPSVITAKSQELIRFYGLRNYIKSLFGRYQYTLRLWLLREVSILLVLIDNYDKVPRKSMTKILLAVPARYAFAKKPLISIERKLRNKIIFNN